jgi:hypothetical protein
MISQAVRRMHETTQKWTINYANKLKLLMLVFVLTTSNGLCDCSYIPTAHQNPRSLSLVSCVVFDDSVVERTESNSSATEINPKISRLTILIPCVHSFLSRSKYLKLCRSWSGVMVWPGTCTITRSYNMLHADAPLAKTLSMLYVSFCLFGDNLIPNWNIQSFNSSISPPGVFNTHWYNVIALTAWNGILVTSDMILSFVYTIT